MEYTVSSTRSLQGSVAAPSSKSYTIRALIAGLLCDGEVKLRNVLSSLDTNACLDVSQKLGLKVVEGEGSGYLVRGCGGELQDPEYVLDTKNSGTTIRLLTAVSSLSCDKISWTGDASIQKRPIQPLLDTLQQLGVQTKTDKNNGCPPHWVKGPLQGGKCTVAGDFSSQYLSGLLMVTPLARKATEIKVIGDLKSKPYVDLTLDVLSKFGIMIYHEEDYGKFSVPPAQTYHAKEYTVESDYSSAAFILAAAALTESTVNVKNLFSSSLQADRKIVGILQSMGVKMKVREDEITVRGDGNLDGVKVDLSLAPDLVPICSVLGAVAHGTTELYNVEHARFKECDRIKAMATELKKLGARIEERKDGLIIEGGELKGARLESWHDHRIIMSCAVAGLVAQGETIIPDAQMAAVTFPNFAELMGELGATISSD